MRMSVIALAALVVLACAPAPAPTPPPVPTPTAAVTPTPAALDPAIRAYLAALRVAFADASRWSEEQRALLARVRTPQDVGAAERAEAERLQREAAALRDRVCALEPPRAVRAAHLEFCRTFRLLAQATTDYWEAVARGDAAGVLLAAAELRATQAQLALAMATLRAELTREVLDAATRAR